MARRVRWCSMSTLCLVFGIFTTTWIQLVRADCYYEDNTYEEGVEVATIEHCLNCTCTRGVLLCYLKVCPLLPNPPPPGCILLHRYRTCCPELICTDFLGEGNTLEGRSDPDGSDLTLFEDSDGGEACVANGSIYSPGSAMDSSSLCEYCFCLRGRETCVKPKCLLPIEGCTPAYDPNQCCPIQYKCSLPGSSSSTTTTPKPSFIKDGCYVDGQYYPEGGKVLGIGHSVCDNCYCLRGMLRCEPLSCAPPLLGCKPIVKPGECCATSYNCTGSIEIDPNPNYGQYPIVSKEYSKLRKEQPKKPNHPKIRRNTTEKSEDPVYIIAETTNRRNQESSGTTRQITSSYFNPGTTTPYYYKAMVKEGASTNGYKHVTRSYPERKFSATTLNDDNNKISQKPAIIIETRKSTTVFGLDGTSSTSIDDITEEFSSVSINTETTTDFYSTDSISTEKIQSTTEELETEQTAMPTLNDQTDSPKAITIKSVSNSTDCIDSIQERLEPTTLPLLPDVINDLSEPNEFAPSSETSSSEVKTDDVTEIDLQTNFNLLADVAPKVKNGSQITSLLNISKVNDYDFDYSEPTLPPSLPNLHIIPFLAADALDTKKEQDNNAIYAQDKSSNDTMEFPNYFSPPVKTEGGFVPNSNPVILGTPFDDILTVPPITTTSIEASCVSQESKIAHGQSVASDSPCATCTCFYGNIVCQKVPCPIPSANCRKSIEDHTLCCPVYICDNDESFPIGLLPPDERDQPIPKLTTADPFKDVIKTEPAPNLQSLMVDMPPYLTKKPVKKTTIYITTLRPETTTDISPKTTQSDDDDLGIDKVLALLLGGGSTPKETTTSVASTESSGSTSLESNNNGAILKLAGCNIYGRMYRVGRIISELSGPCLECKCTEVGVQCKPLKC